LSALYIPSWEKSQGRGDMPSLGNLVESHCHWVISSVHAYIRSCAKLKKSMMSAKLRSEWAEGVDVNLILDNCAAFGA